LVADGIHYDDARGGQTWGVCRKVVEQLRSKAPPMKPVCPLRYNCFPPRADTEGDARPVRVTRLEVIGPNGRIFSKWDCGIQLSYQDGGRKLKVFVDWQPLPDPPVQP
jgi:hypothetical protein